MRVVSGKYKRRRFDVPKGFKARPTTDFAKENLFNVLMGYIDFEEEMPKALDLFAGTGGISIELVSRGCSQVISVEKDKKHFSFIQTLVTKLDAQECIPICGDVFRYIDRCKQSFDLIFADPPYALTKLAELPDLIFAKDMLSENGLFILEHGKDHQFTDHPHFLEQRNYGSVHFSFFR